MYNYTNLYNAIFKGSLEDAEAAVTDAVANNCPADEIINECMIKAMAAIGDEFESGRAFVPNLLMSARSMKGALQILKPLMSGDNTNVKGIVVIGTVRGDLHDIGKNLVASMLEGSGFEVHNLGNDVKAETFVEKAKEYNADIICLSALLTTTMQNMKEVIDEVEKAGLKGKVKVMIGGAPITQSFADQIGADGYSDNANSAVALALKLISR